MSSNKVAPQPSAPAAAVAASATEQEGLRQRKAASPEEAATKIQAASRAKQSKKRVSNMKIVKDKVDSVLNKFHLSPGDQLLTDPRVLHHSLNAVQFAIFVDAVCSQILMPNYPMMCGQYGGGPKEEAFPSASWPKFPDDYTIAVNIIPGAALLGQAIAGMIIAPLSDKIGRKPCILACLWMGSLGCALKYIFRKTFWGFVGMNFLNGLFGASLPVAFAYVGDLYPTDEKKQQETMGGIMGVFMLGMSGGGVLSILFKNEGLFFGLLIGVGFSALGALVIHKWMIDAPKDFGKEKSKDEGGGNNAPAKKDGEQKAEEKEAPIDWKAFNNILAGCLLDNFGSVGMQLAMNPLMVMGFATLPSRDCCMSATTMQWLLVCFALTIIVGIAASLPIFSKFGTAGGCIFGNFMTAVVIVVLLMIYKEAKYDYVSESAYILFVTVLYAGYPTTVISQLSTGPMLEVIAPPSRRGFVQGLNTAAMQVATAIGPPLISTLADDTKPFDGGYDAMIWTCVGFSVMACIVNYPLTLDKRFGKPDQSKEHEKADLVCPDGTWVSAEEQQKRTLEAMAKGEPIPNQHYGSYEADADSLAVIMLRARSDLDFQKNSIAAWILRMKDPALAETMSGQWKAVRPNEEQRKQSEAELGKWFTDYLSHHGYFPETNSPVMMKSMIMTAFPPILKGKAAIDPGPKDMKPMLLGFLKLTNKYIREGDSMGKDIATIQAANAFVGRG